MDRKLSLSDVSKASGISISYLNEIEKGKKYPKANKIAQMAKALDVSYDWLVSLQLSKNLRPIAELIKSDLLTSLPLEIFGIEPGDLVDLISNTPTKISAFISTLIELARNYNIGVENFYFAVLRSYQEMHDNYFEDIEEYVDQFIEDHPDFKNPPISLDALREVLEKQHKYQIEVSSFENYAELDSLRSVLIPGNPKRFILNQDLNPNQQMFTFGREIGYNFMKIKERAYTSSWVKIKSFEQLLNNFKASYFSGALLIPRTYLFSDMQNFLSRKQWDSSLFLEMMYKYRASPEMFLYRLTSILPKFFGLNALFFLRFNHKIGSDGFILDKEIHLGGSYNPHSNVQQEHYCRRWISLNILKELEDQANQNSNQAICSVQRSKYIDSENEFLCISMARPFAPTPNTNSSLTIGLLLNTETKRKIKFWNDDQIPVREVGVTCERCSLIDCKDRVVPPNHYLNQEKTKIRQESLEQFIKDNT